ncbi:MAG: RagB/SusD family nutrient uptake outer membrane protein [Cyclobacteriaceae bacterium]|nr:RagB/SusD family nutrient uptake outer membrane protein [Cyclobacteriaceae bacterium]UYN88434.1 MAG: RagB/SusD family nutrient uptake outer membrane protein [Cyclobacteriaceae bacterium]
MRKEKLNLKVAFVALVLVAVVGCEAPDQNVFSAIPESVQRTTTDPIALAAVAQSAYVPLIGTWGGHNSLWSLHEISSDEMVIAQKGADWEDGGQWIRVHRHQYLPTEESIGNGWAYCYSSIATINNLLKTLGTNPLLRSEFEALRAMVYLWLLDAYGNVPIITETTTDTTPDTKTRQEVFNFVETSILTNLDNLRKARTYGTMNWYVAQCVLAKLYLNAGIYTGTPRWADAAAAAQEVISSGVYSLETNFFRNFQANNAGSVENIFILNYDEVNAGGFNLAQMTGHYLTQETFNLQQQPWNGYASLEEFYNSFSDGDARKGSFLVGPQFSAVGVRLIDGSAEPTDPDGPPLTFTPEINMLAPNSFRQAGARVGKFEFQTGAAPNLSNDFPIFRYADVLLMRAEALWRQTPGSAEALSLVNQVRARAGVAPLAALTADDLLAERGREMFAEGYRRSDLIRFGKYNAAWWEKPVSDPSKNIFPIPQNQILVNTGLVQNPGY